MSDLGRYRLRKGLILAFHGCDASVANKVFGTNHHLSSSENDDDWLGHGVYFWENNPERALEWAGKKGSPAVIGAILDLGLCLDLTESVGCKEVKQAHQLLKDSSKSMPVNRSGPDTKRRYLDCAVIQYAHAIRAAAEPPLYQSAFIDIITTPSSTRSN